MINDERADSPDTPVDPWELYCPVPPAELPHGADYDCVAADWLRRFELRDHAWLDAMERARPLELLATACPAGIPDRLQMVGDFWLWAYALDDAYFDSGTLTGDPGGACIMVWPLMCAVEPAPAHAAEANGWETGLRDVRDRIAGCGSPAQTDRWAAATRGMLFSFAFEAAIVQRGRHLGLREYLAHRMESCGAKLFVLLIDFIHGYELPTAVLADNTVRAMTEAACVILGIDNDLFSYGREQVLEAGATLNSIDVVAAEFQLSTEQALVKTVEIRNRIMGSFLELSALVHQRGNADLAHYSRNLGQWIRANIDWSVSTRRYRDHTPDSGSHLSVLGAPCLSIGVHPHRDGPQPATWWWNHLTQPAHR